MSKILLQFVIINAEKSVQMQNMLYMHIPLRDMSLGLLMLSSGRVYPQHIRIFLLV